MKFDFNNFSAYVIHEYEDGCFISDCYGFVMEAEQMKELAKGLIDFADKHKEDLEEHNQQRKIEHENETNDHKREIEKLMNEPKQVDHSGYVYLFECGGKYKIGYSKNVERRMKDLDYRPFPINLITKTCLLEDAYKVEQYIHENLSEYKVIGEWYAFTDDQVQKLKKMLEALGGYYNE